MNWLLDDPWLRLLAEVLVFATLLAAGFVVAVRTVRDAARREAIALAGVFVLLLLPAVRLLGDGLQLGVPLLPSHAAAPFAPATTAADLAATPAAPLPALTIDGERSSAPSPAGTAAASTTEPRAWQLPRAGTLLLAAWLAAAAWSLVRSLLRARRLAHAVRALPAASPALQHTLAAAAAAVGLRRSPDLHAAPPGTCPATVGLWRPRLLVPGDLLAAHGERAAAAILRHECAHLRLGHHRHGVAVVLLRAIFGWHPFAAALLRAHEDAQEEHADRAAAAGGDADCYAGALVALAERCAVPESVPFRIPALGRSPLRRRVQRLLALEVTRMQVPTPFGRAATIAAAALSLSAAAAVRLAPAQDPAREHPAAASAFMPLQAGSSWTWRITQVRDDQTTTSELVAWDSGAVPAGDMQCEQWLVTSSKHDRVDPEYWSADATGIYQHDRVYLGSIRGPRKSRTRLLPGPVGVETKWTWFDQLAYQTMGNVQRDTEADKITCVGELVAPDAVVTVPAGEFRAAHVRITRTCSHWQGPHVRELWFARGVGIVKETENSYGGRRDRELLSHQLSRVGAIDDDSLLAAHLRADGRTGGGAPEITWVPRGEEACYLPDRYAVVRFTGGVGAKNTAFALIAGKVVEIPVDDPAFWSDRMAAAHASPPVVAKREPAPAGAAPGIAAIPMPDNLDDGFSTTFIVRAIGEVEARRRGLTEVRSGGSRSESVAGKASHSVTVNFTGKDGGGTARRFEVAVDLDGNKINKLRCSTHDVPPPAVDKGRVPGLPLPPGTPGRR